MAVLGRANRQRTIPALCALVIVVSTIPLGARQPPSQPYVNDKIETALDSCLSTPAGSATTLSISGCYQTAENRYQTAINIAYKTALAHVDATTAARLRQSQATWVTFRKDVSAVIKAPWTADRGTIVESQVSQSEILSLKARILEIDLVWPGFPEGDEPLEIGSEKTK